MSAHFRSNTAAASLFDARVQHDPAGAVRLMHARGLHVDEADVPTPFSSQLAALAPSMRGDFHIAHDAELAQERTARTLARSSANLLAQRDGAAGAQREADRQSWIAARADEIARERLADQRRTDEAQAAREHDAAHAAQQPGPKPPTPKRRAAEEQRHGH